MRARLVAAALMSFFGVAAGVVATLNGPVAVWAPLAGVGLVCAAGVVVLTVLEQGYKAAAERAPTKVGLAGHLEPRSRGAELGEPGWYFTGRARAIQELSAWLVAGHDPKTRVVTGEPGVGKSALIGRLVMLSDRWRRQEILAHEPDLAGELRFEVGVIDVAVNAAKKTVEQVADEIATALRLGERLPALVVEALSRAEPMRRVVVDSLDEATDPHELIAALLIPFGRSPRVQLLVGTRRPFVRALGGDEANVVLDLDPEAQDYFERRDVVDYVGKRLMARGRYPDTGLAKQVAEAITARAGGNFLIAQLAARYRAERPPDITAPDWQNQLPDSVGEAMDQDLRRLGAKQRLVRELLLALAYVEGSGLPRHGGVWEAIASALAGAADRRLSDVFDDRRALAYVADQVEDGRRVYRLYHRALAEHLQAADGPDDAQARIASALVKLVPDAPGRDGGDWANADPYVRAHLASHAAAGGALDHLLEDPDYLVAADPRRLLRALPAAHSPAVADIRRAYQRVVHHLPDAAPAERAAYLHMAAQCIGATTLAEQVARRHPDRPWTVPWARWRAEAGHFIAGRHDGPVGAVAVGELDGRPVAVSGGVDGTLRMWDLATGAPLGEPLTGHHDEVWAVAVGERDGRPVIVSGGDDATLRVWDLATGAPLGEPLTGHHDRVWAVAVGERDGRPVIVSGGEDATLRVWDLAAGAPLGEPLTGHDGPVWAVAVGERDGRPVIVSGGDNDGTLRVWDLATGRQLGEPLTGHDGPVCAVAVGERDGRPVIVSGGADATLRVWDLAAGAPLGEPLTGHHDRVEAVAVGERDGRPVIVSGGDNDGTLRVWDLATGRQLDEPLTGHHRPVYAVAVGERDGRPVIVSGGEDATLRVWDLAAGAPLGEPLTGHDGPVWAVAVGERDGRPVIVSGGDNDGTLRVWDLATGRQLGEPLTGHDGPVCAVAVGERDGRPVIVSGGADATLRVWDLAAGAPLGEPLTGHHGPVRAVAVGERDGRPVIVSGGDDATLRVWDLATGVPLGEPLTGHHGPVYAVAVGERDGRPVIVSGGSRGSGGSDATLWVWDLAAGAPLGEPLSGHNDSVEAVAVGERDGRPVIVSNSWGGTLRVWDLAAGVPLGEPLSGHDGLVRAVAVGERDGRPVIVSGGDDGMLRVWDLAGSELAVINVGSPVQATGVRGATIVVGASAGVMALELPLAARVG